MVTPRTRHGSPWLTALGFVLVPTAALAAGGGDDHGPSFWLQVVNMALLLGVLVYFARKPLSDYFTGERQTVKSEMASASELLADAEKKNAEWQRKLSALDAELADIRESTRRRAEEERAQILAEAAEGAERIQRDAAAAIEQDVRKAKAELRAEVAQLASELAAERLKQNMSDGDRQRLVDEFISNIESSGARS